MSSAIYCVTELIVSRLYEKGNVIRQREITLDYTYHPFYPIYIPEAQQQKTEIVFDSIVPAFFLKVNEDKTFWSNVITAGEYTLDAVTTLSGIGNIAKFRHLAKVLVEQLNYLKEQQIKL